MIPDSVLKRFRIFLYGKSTTEIRKTFSHELTNNGPLLERVKMLKDIWEKGIFDDVNFCPHCGSTNIEEQSGTGWTGSGNTLQEMDYDYTFCNSCEKSFD